MIHHTPSAISKAAWAAAILFAACISCHAAEAPRLEPAAQGAQPTLPRMPWGDPDMTGIWNFVVDGTMSPFAMVDFVHGPQQSCLEISGVQGRDQLPPEFMKWPGSLVKGTADGEVPYQPWAKAKRAERLLKLTNPQGEDFMASSARCLLAGMPAAMLRRHPRVYQFPDHILMVWEYPQMHRIIWTDGRPAPPSQIKLWQGFSVGRWQGDTLTVTTSNQNGFPWLDATGDLMSENTRVTEYFEVRPANIAYKVVIEDPLVYTQPWWMEWRLNVLKPGVPLNPFDAMMLGNGEILEAACVEGERHHFGLPVPGLTDTQHADSRSGH